MRKQYLVQKNKNGKIKYLLFIIDGKRITREWGLIGGEIQGNYYDYGPNNVGKANAMTAEEAAEADFNRITAIKMKEGYTPTETLESLPALPEHDEIVDLNDIPTEFCCSKPTQTITPAAINKLLKSGHSKTFVKYNGGCHYIVIDSTGEISLFTRRWDDHSSKYPSIIEDVKRHHLPAETMLITEFCIDPLMSLDHMTAQKRFSEISKANTNKGVCKPSQEKALKRQVEYPVKAGVFGILYYDGSKVWDKPYAEIYDMICDVVSPLSHGNRLFVPQEVNLKSGKQAFEIALIHKKKIEGFVIWDDREAMEVTMNGKPLRRAAWKIKAKAEMDVIAVGGVVGKKAGLYGSLQIGVYNNKGKFIDMGTVGGLKHNKGEADPSYWSFPCVIEVTFDNRFPDTGLLQFGSFSKVHEDKTVEEVDFFSLP